MKLIVLLFFISMFSACATTGSGDSTPCVAGKFDNNRYPCWVNKKPDRGVVLSMAEHVEPGKTREILFNKALLEISAADVGLEVSENSIVRKEIKVSNNDSIKQQAKVITLATVKTANAGVIIKARVEDEWKHPTSRKLFLWVVRVD